MYQSDAEVEADVAALRRRLKEEPVERQVRIRKHATDVRAHDIKGGEKLRWWIVSVPGRAPDSNWVWFAFDRNGRGKLEVRERANKVELLAEVDTVEAALMAGMMMVDRPS